MLSIIIPVYNAEPWIERCLQSVVAQTISRWECIVVDNNSTDKSLEKAREYVSANGMAEKFVFLSMSENGGPGTARNAGMRVAKGKYLTFLDADDYLDNDIYERLLSHTASAPDIVLGNTALPSASTRSQLLRGYPPSSCFHLYRREFVVANNLSFPPERTSEDSYFVATCILTAATWVTTTDYGYVIYEHPTSVSRRKDPERYKLKLKVFARLINFARQRGLLEENRGALRQIYFRKALLMSLKEYITNNRPWRMSQIGEIISEAKSQLSRI